jgi:hypothetical protein
VFNAFKLLSSERRKTEQTRTGQTTVAETEFVAAVHHLQGERRRAEWNPLGKESGAYLNVLGQQHRYQ